MKNLNFVLDTDVGCDCDDIIAIAYLIYAKRKFGFNFKAITHSNGAGATGLSAIASVFTFYGEELPPLGEEKGKFVNDTTSYAYAMENKFGKYDGKIYPAKDLLRKTLAECEDDSVVICAIGPFTNIANLLLSTGDEYSPLSGVKLVKKKVKKLVVMAGQFDKHVAEWNVKVDVTASQNMANLCPVPTYFLPFEVGENMITGGPIIASCGEDNPVSLSLIKMHFGDVDKIGGRHSWDPASAVYAIEGVKDFFIESESGKVTVDDEGQTTFTPSENGLHKILNLKQKGTLDELQLKKVVADYINDCIDTI